MAMKKSEIVGLIQSEVGILPGLRHEDVESLSHKVISGIEGEDRSRSAALRFVEDSGWNKDLVLKAMELKPEIEVLNKLSWELWIELGVHRVLEKKGETHFGKKILPISFISYMSSILLDRCSLSGVAPPCYLVFLIRELLGVERYGHASVRLPQKEYEAALFLATNPKSSLSEISEAVDVDKATVSRWKKTKFFKDRVRRLTEDDDARFDQERNLQLGLPLPDSF